LHASIWQPRLHQVQPKLICQPKQTKPSPKAFGKRERVFQWRFEIGLKKRIRNHEIWWNDQICQIFEKYLHSKFKQHQRQKKLRIERLPCGRCSSLEKVLGDKQVQPE